MGNIYLVCEGTPAGLDERVLNALVVQHHNLSVQVVPAGGSKGLGSIRAYLAGGLHDTAIRVGDRDHTVSRAEANAEWAVPDANQYHWRRHEIENFLLHPGVLLALADDYRASGSAWAATWPATDPDALALLTTVATPLLEDHVGEVLRAELAGQLSAIGSQFGPPRPGPVAGAAAPVQAAWVAALQAEAMRLRGAFAAAAAHRALDPANIAARYATLLTQCQASLFLPPGDFLVEMGGHELMSALANHLQATGMPPGFSSSILESELLRVLGKTYEPGITYQPDDFQDLATILAQY